MRTIQLSIMLILLFSGTTLLAQTTEPQKKQVPNWIIEANTLKKERAIKDLKLSEAEAEKYYELTLQSVVATTERMSLATSEDEKKAIRADESKKLRESILASFSGKLGPKIASWNAEYWAKYLKK